MEIDALSGPMTGFLECVFNGPPANCPMLIQST